MFYGKCKKKNILRMVLSAFIMLCLLFITNFLCIHTSVYAASEFDLYLSGTLTPGATLTATPPTGSLTESWAGTYIVFCEHEAMAQNAYNSVGTNTDSISDAIDSINACEGEKRVLEVNYVSGSSVTVPSGSHIKSWKMYRSQKKVRGPLPAMSNLAPYIFLVVYVAEYETTINYYSNDGENQTYTDTVTTTFADASSGSSFTLAADDTFSRTGYSLVKWKERGGGDFEYEPGSSYGFGNPTTYSFDAVWEPLSSVTVKVHYNPNGGDGSTVTQTENVDLDPGAPETGDFRLWNTTEMTRDGYRLVGWQASDGNAYSLGESYEFSSDVTDIYFDAIWEELPIINIPVTYRPNGGSGTVISENEEVQLDIYDEGSFTLRASADFTRPGYKLTGWKDQDGMEYDLGDTYDVVLMSDPLTFDAIWTEKIKGTVDIDIKKPVYVGAEIKYDIDKNSKGDVTVEYKKKDEKDEKYSKKVPTEPGKYTVRATLEETDEYTAAEDTSEFDIDYLAAPDNPYSYREVKNSAGTVTDVKVIPAEGYSISSSADADFASSISYTAVKAAGGSVYLKREKDKAITAAVKITEYHLEDTIKLTVPSKIYYGTELKVTASSLSPAKKVIEYKKAGAPDNAYSATVPTTPGDYIVRFSAPESGLYLAVNETKNFSIVYLETPSDKAYLDGKKGDDGWFKSDVEIKAPKGYLISTTLGTGYTDSIEWSDKIKKLYYQRDDGAMTDAVDFDPSAKIDMKAPVAKFDSSLGINNPSGTVKVTLDNLTFTLEDDNLEKVTVNGKPYDVSKGKCVISLDSGSDTESWTVVATDKAGNSYTFTVELSPQWMSNNVMPAGRVVTLKSNIEYSFSGEGEWMVEIDGKVDDTVYAGGNKFFVKGNMECKFVKKTEA